MIPNQRVDLCKPWQPTPPNKIRNLNNKKSAFLRVAAFDNQEFKADVD